MSLWDAKQLQEHEPAVVSANADPRQDSRSATPAAGRSAQRAGEALSLGTRLYSSAYGKKMLNAEISSANMLC